MGASQVSDGDWELLEASGTPGDDADFLTEIPGEVTWAIELGGVEEHEVSPCRGLCVTLDDQFFAQAA